MLAAAALRPPSPDIGSYPTAHPTDGSPALPLTLDPATYYGPRAPTVDVYPTNVNAATRLRKQRADHISALVVAKTSLVPALKEMLANIPVLPRRGSDGVFATSFKTNPAFAKDRKPTMTIGRRVLTEIRVRPQSYRKEELAEGVPNLTAHERVWLMWALTRVEQGLQQKHVGLDWRWLRVWRERNGHVHKTGSGLPPSSSSSQLEGSLAAAATPVAEASA